MERASVQRKVLFVEDEPAIRSTYVRCFGSSYEMAFAASGKEALLQLRTFKPDVLVLDMRLPDTDGVALLQQIRASHPTLPVVVTTAYVSMEPLIDVLDLGHSGYLVKPFNMDELSARIDAAS
jgi:DNA-binding response OmpR family regulator